MKYFIDHKVVDHSIWYVTKGNIHTNSIESFWALLKRGIVGQFHKVSVKHLSKYVDEFCYRYNHRSLETKEEPNLLFDLTISKGLGVVQ